ncbi:MAG: hypothetical protein ABJN69_09935 [Hellea sp.]
MNRETRILEIEKRMKQPAIAHKEIMWEDDLMGMDVFKIPLQYLVYNKYNGRILSKTKSLETQDKVLNPENDTDKKIIEKLLWDSKPDRNKKTENDIKTHGQKEVGIITKDGIIIDGNRRAMLLNRIDHLGYFKAVILPVTLEENPIAIEKLETSYQMGEDEKLGYNPIEKYLKAKMLRQKGVTVKDISNWMGETETTVKEYLGVMETMDDYLDYLGYNDIYTQLYNREDQLINLSKWLKTFSSGGSARAFDGYQNDDVDDLKAISFDYIRVKFEGKKFRNIAHGLKQNHFFGSKIIWDSFRDKHASNIDSVSDQEDPPNLDTNNIQATLNDRDEKFKTETIALLDENIDEHYNQLRYKQAQDEPEKLINNARRAIDSINTRSGNFKNDDVVNKLDELRAKISEMISDSSAILTLQHVGKLLSDIDLSETAERKNELLEKIKFIARKAYELEKTVKKGP